MKLAYAEINGEYHDVLIDGEFCNVIHVINNTDGEFLGRFKIDCGNLLDFFHLQALMK